MDKITKHVPATVKSVDEEKRTIRFIASSEDRDRYGDIIKQDGWDFNNFLANPVLMREHYYDEAPMGRIIEIKVNENMQLEAVAEFVPKGINPTADLYYEEWRLGFIRTVSVGFRGSEYKDDDLGRIFTRMELLEISLCAIPANPKAVALAKNFEVEAKGLFETDVNDKISKMASKIDLLSDNMEALKSYRAFVKSLRNKLGVEASDDELETIERVKSAVMPPQRETLSEDQLFLRMLNAAEKQIDKYNN